MSDIKQTIREFCDESNSDLLFYFGDIKRPKDDEIISECGEKKRRKNVTLLLTTLGGDPHAAYRIGRCLQAHYSSDATAAPNLTKNKSGSGTFSVFVNSVCKSAGTILSCGANKIYMTRRAEFGPIDIQLRKTDEVGEFASTLTSLQALEYLENQSIKLFKRHFTDLRFDKKLAFSTKMAAEVATAATIGLLTPIYSQLDPIRLAEVDRSLRISSDYVSRLATRNMRPKALERLIGSYPSHSFVIDRKEAGEIFAEVEDPPQKLYEIGEFWRQMADTYLNGDSDEPFHLFMSDWAMMPDQAEESKEASSTQEKEDSADGTKKPDGEGVRDADRNQPSAYAGRNLKAVQSYADRNGRV